jgi:hypothetical protein
MADLLCGALRKLALRDPPAKSTRRTTPSARFRRGRLARKLKIPGRIRLDVTTEAETMAGDSDHHFDGPTIEMMRVM